MMDGRKFIDDFNLFARLCSSDEWGENGQASLEGKRGWLAACVCR